MNREMKWGSQIKLLTYWGGIQEQREKNKVKNMKYLNEVRSFLIWSTPNILLHDSLSHPYSFILSFFFNNTLCCILVYAILLQQYSFISLFFMLCVPLKNYTIDDFSSWKIQRVTIIVIFICTF
jgi:hypothetical protein